MGVTDKSPTTGKPWRARVIDAAPVGFLTRSHELAVSLLLAALGAPALLDLLPGQSRAGIPLWEFQAWGGAMVLSGALTWWGVLRNRPRAEWGGQIIAGWALAYFVGILASLSFTATLPSIITFGLLAVVSWWRAFKITSAAFVQHRLIREARDAHMAVRDVTGKARR